MKSSKARAVGVAALMCVAAAARAADDSGCSDHCQPAPLIENRFWTSAFGPAQANVVESGTNFLTCQGNRFALCYYSGPDREQMPPTRFGGVPAPELTCVTDAHSSGVASCECYAIDEGTNYVDINSITNTEAYIETVRACGLDGSRCRNMVSDLGCRSGDGPDPASGRCDLPTAPVCSYLGNVAAGMAQDLVPGADRISTFSFDHALHYDFGSTDCTSENKAGLYAGCMTAPCTDYTAADGKTYSRCQCPTYDGPYQVGQKGTGCPLAGGYVWSAAYTPPSQQQDVQETLTRAGGMEP